MTEVFRQSQALDGLWSFRLDSGPWREALVPMPWQAQFADLRHASGTGHYARRFQAAALPADHHWVLKFGAVSEVAEVRVNGQPVGRHEGGYLPFECPLDPAILTDSNLLEVTAYQPAGAPDPDPARDFAQVPHGKQSWYGPLGGIWQSVVLEARHDCHLRQAAIRATLANGEVALTLHLTSPCSVSVTILDPAGRAVGHASGPDPILALPDPEPWHPDSPALYTARISLSLAGQVVDVTEHRFGFRHFETRDGRFYLNGAPFYLRGALDQDYYPEGICTPPSTAFLEDQFRKAKALGLNMLRCHIKIPDPRYYEVADRLGLLIWTEIPNVASLTTASAAAMKSTMQGILARDGNHPCIVIWTLINEDWGTRLIEDASHRAWLSDFYDWLKQADPTRLVVDNSPCHHNFHVKTDINDYHYYRSIPERRAEWDGLTAEFAAGADWLWSPHGDAHRRGDEPLVVSEFGVWGLPDPEGVRLADGSEPWWMETGSDWGDGVAYPHGVQQRFALNRLNSVFADFQSFIHAVQWYQFANLKAEIEEMRAHGSIMGYVITEFTDVHWESNGLMDMNRNLRIFADRFAEVNADLVIVPRLLRGSGWAGVPFDLSLMLATGGVSLPEGCQIAWQIGAAQGTLPVPAIPSCTARDLGPLRVPLPDQAGMAALSLRLIQGGRELARNQAEIAVFACAHLARRPRLAIASPRLAAHAEGLGYSLAAPEEADVILTHGLTAEDIARMQEGARYLVLADGTLPLAGSLRTDSPGRMLLPDIVLTERDRTIWRGDWIAGFSWIRRAGAFASLPGGPLLDPSYDRVAPHHVMTGFRAWEYAGAVHAGLVVGWVHKPAALIAERRVGRGGMVASTFRLLNDAPLADPVATALFDALVQTAAGLPVDG